jgi:hypothetical protein
MGIENSGIDEVGVIEAFVESDMTETVLSPELETNISPLPES